MKFARNQFLLLLLRNEFRLYLRGGFAKASSMVFLVIGQVLLHAIALSVAWGLSMGKPQWPPATALIMFSGGLLAMFMLMTSRSLASAVQALYTRGDMDLLLSSPVDRRAVTGVRMGAVALTVALEVALLVWPFANAFVLFGYFAWARAYLLVPAMAMLCTSIGLALTLLAFRTLGPRRTRIVVQVLAVLVGMGIMLAVYLPRMLGNGPAPGRGAAPFSGNVEMLLRNSGGARELLVTPAHWLMQGFLPTLAFFVAAAALLWITIQLAGDRIVSAMTAITAGSGRRTRSETVPGGRVPEFRHGFRTTIVLKELKLLARDPHLIAQLLRQGVLTLPAAFMLWNIGRTTDMPLPWLAVIVLVAGLAGPLSWITLTAEDAPDLLASAPVSRAALFRAKIEAALLPVLPLCLLPLFFLLHSHPWFAVCTTFCAMAAALCAALINTGNPVAKRRDSFRTRHQGNGFRGFLEVVSLIFWAFFAVGLAWAGKLLAGWH